MKILWYFVVFLDFFFNIVKLGEPKFMVSHTKSILIFSLLGTTRASRATNIFLWPKHFIFLSYHSINHYGCSCHHYHHCSSSTVATAPNGLRCHRINQHRLCPSPISMNVRQLLFRFLFREFLVNYCWLWGGTRTWLENWKTMKQRKGN